MAPMGAVMKPKRRFVWDSDLAIQLVAMGLILFIALASLLGRRSSPLSRTSSGVTFTARRNIPPPPLGADWETLHQYYHIYGIPHGHKEPPPPPSASHQVETFVVDPTDPSTWIQPFPNAPPPPGFPR